MLCQRCSRAGRGPRRGRELRPMAMARTAGQPPVYASNRVRIGLHARNDYDFTPTDYEIIRRAKIETLKTMSHTRLDVYKKLRDEHPQLEFIVRLYDDRIGGNKSEKRGWHPSAADFVAKFVPLLNDLRPYATKFEIHNEPNHQEYYEGWGPTLDQAADFNGWFLDVYRGLKAACPWAELGFPGLALHTNGQLYADLEWAKACSEAIAAADWLGVHCYWQYSNLFSADWGFYFTAYHKQFPDKMIEITEFADSTPGLDPKAMAQNYASYYAAMQRHGVYLRSASAFIATSPDSGWASFCWGQPSDGKLNPVVDSVSEVIRLQVVSEAPIDKVAKIVERRFRLPTRAGAELYGTRDIKDIQNIVIHQSDSATASAEAVAQWAVTQTDGGGRAYYPEMPYHFFVEPNGAIKRCHSLEVLSWHAGAAGQASPGGVGLNNWQGVAVCLAGAFSGSTRPTSAQLTSAAALCAAIRATTGTKLEILGHGETPYSQTACPGTNFKGDAGWKNELLRLVGDLGPEPAVPVYAYELTHQTPAQIEAGATVTVPVTLKNTGSLLWRAAGDKATHLSYHWVDSAGQVAVRDGERTVLPADLASGEQVALSAAVKGPPAPGSYVLRWDPVQEQVTWFSEQNASPVDVPVTVTQPAQGKWSLSASRAGSDAGKAADGDAKTAWQTGGPQADGDWFQVDLGRVERVSGVKAQSPAGASLYSYVISVSTDGQSWTEVYREENNRGDVDITFPVRRARYIKLQVVLRQWGIQALELASEPEPGLLVTASYNSGDAAKALDGDPLTIWSTTVPQIPGMWVQVDLGKALTISKVTLEGPAKEFPRGLKITVSADGNTWEAAASKARFYSAPVSLQFGAKSARYVRLEQTSSYIADQGYKIPWSISEIAIA